MCLEPVVLWCTEVCLVSEQLPFLLYCSWAVRIKEKKKREKISGVFFFFFYNGFERFSDLPHALYFSENTELVADLLMCT